jgi:hypothetical protein
MASLIPYYVVKRGYGYWQPTRVMRDIGFSSVPCGPDGPEAWSAANSWNLKWQEQRSSRSGRVVELAGDTRGFVYFLMSNDRVKIGFSKNPFRRGSDLLTGFSHRPHAMVAIHALAREERELHQRFARWRTRGEWFVASAPVMRVIFCSLLAGRLVPDPAEREQSQAKSWNA